MPRTSKAKAPHSSRRTPSYRRQRRKGKPDLAFVEIDGKRHYLGTYDTPESREQYDRLIAEWLSHGRRLPVDPDEIAIVELHERFWEHLRTRHGQSELWNYKACLQVVTGLYGSEPAVSFGPRRLRVVRQQLAERGIVRKQLNKQVSRIRAMFRWAASHELIPASVHEALRTVEPLRRGDVPNEGEAVRPVPRRRIRCVRPHLSRPVRALVALQLLTGARPGELVGLRSVDLDTSGPVWTYTPAEHKTAHHDHERVIYFGPRAQRVLRVFMLDRPVTDPLFSPRMAERERYATCRTHRSTGQRPRPHRTSRTLGEAYTVHSYRRSIKRACDHAYPPPAELARRRVPGRGRKADAARWETDTEWRNRLGPERWERLKAWRRDNRWHPHQLRHNAGTFLRREFGLEVASIILGHSSLVVTQTYAEANRKKALEIIGKVG